MTADGDVDVLRALLRVSLPTPRRRPLMEALGFLHRENRHSDFLAWLLDPTNGTDGASLVRGFLRHARVERNLGKPESVAREVTQAGDRPDIVVSWPDFKLIIENKVWSHEGDRQCARYLSSFEIDGPEAGRLVFLDLRGRWPDSVGRDDDRVVSMSYRDLREMVGECAHQVDDARTRILMNEYAETLAQLTATRITMDKPQVSRCTLEYAAAQDTLSRMAQVACRESADYVAWTVGLLEDNLRKVLGEDLVCEETFGCAWVFRRKSWRQDGLGYGLGYSVESRPGRRVLPEYPHLVGVRVQPVEGTSSTDDQPTLTASLVAWLKQHWTAAIKLSDGTMLASPSDLRRDNQWWPWYTSMALGAEDDWDRWSELLVEAVTESARKLAPLLDGFALRP